MTKNDTPPSLKMEASASKNDLSDLMQEAADVIKREEDELAELSPADRAANLKTRAFMEKLTPAERSKFFSFIGNEEFFNTFERYITGEGGVDEDNNPPSRMPDHNESADSDEMPVNQGIQYRAMSDAEKARLYEELLESQRQEVSKKINFSRPVPAFQNKWGLQISLKTRTEQDLGVTKVILRKQDRGSDPISRKKTRDKVVKALEPKISAGNLSRMLTSVEADDYDVAEDAISWQTILHSINRFILQYDMTSLMMIPQGVDLSKPNEVAKAMHFKHAIVAYQDLGDEDYYSWQEFILRYGTDVEIESDNWLEDVLRMSMEKTLRSEVESDLNSIPRKYHGSLTTLRCIIKRMVVRNQEARDALGNYIKNFDINTFPGENVPTACLRLKAVALALGEKDLPTNTIRRVLEGFGKSSTTSFNEFCASQIALRRGSFYERLMQTNSLQTQLNEILKDLESTYLDLVGGKLWAGINASPTKSAFVVDYSLEDEINEARALALQKKIPFEEWAKLYAKCHHCGEKGHIRPHCPQYIEKVKSGEIKPPFKRNAARNQPPKPRREYSKDPKAKALWVAAFNAIFGEDDEDGAAEEVAGVEQNQDREPEEHDTETGDEDMRSFLSLAGSLKE